MPIKIHMLPLGALSTNCYIVADTDTQEAIIIDPSDQADVILGVIESESYVVKEILATHGHFDHVLASAQVKAATGAPFRIHAADVGYLQRAKDLAARYGIEAPDPAVQDSFIAEGDIFEVGNIHLATRFTPGHAPGHVSFVMASHEVVFSGDCLFQGSIGRTDLPGGDYNTLMTSITEKLLTLGDQYTVCNGHGPTTTIGQERQRNPFLLEWLDRYGE